MDLKDGGWFKRYKQVSVISGILLLYSMVWSSGAMDLNHNGASLIVLIISIEQRAGCY